MTNRLPHGARDLRTCAVGDSFVAGVGDPEHRGWVGRVVTGTLYNLGVRRDTSADVLARWAAECAPRLPPGVEGRVVVSFGVNDTTAEGDAVRVDPRASAANLRGLLATARVPVLVVGPPPVDDVAQNARIAALSTVHATVCATAGVPFVPVVDALLADPVWSAEVAAGDGPTREPPDTCASPTSYGRCGSRGSGPDRRRQPGGMLAYMRRTTVKLPDDLDRAMRDEAARRGLTLSEWTREAIQSHLPQQRGRRRLLSTAAGRSGELDVSERIEEILAVEWPAARGR